MYPASVQSWFLPSCAYTVQHIVRYSRNILLPIVTNKFTAAGKEFNLLKILFVKNHFAIGDLFLLQDPPRVVQLVLRRGGQEVRKSLSRLLVGRRQHKHVASSRRLHLYSRLPGSTCVLIFIFFTRSYFYVYPRTYVSKTCVHKLRAHRSCRPCFFSVVFEKASKGRCFARSSRQYAPPDELELPPRLEVVESWCSPVLVVLGRVV